MPNGDLLDRFPFPTLTFMMDSYSSTPERKTKEERNIKDWGRDGARDGM